MHVMSVTQKLIKLHCNSYKVQKHYSALLGESWWGCTSGGHAVFFNCFVYYTVGTVLIHLSTPWLSTFQLTSAVQGSNLIKTFSQRRILLMMWNSALMPEKFIQATAWLEQCQQKTSTLSTDCWTHQIHKTLLWGLSWTKVNKAVWSSTPTTPPVPIPV